MEKSGGMLHRVVNPSLQNLSIMWLSIKKENKTTTKPSLSARILTRKRLQYHWKLALYSGKHTEEEAVTPFVSVLYSVTGWSHSRSLQCRQHKANREGSQVGIPSPPLSPAPQTWKRNDELLTSSSKALSLNG